MNFDLTVRMFQTLGRPAEPAEWKRKAERPARLTFARLL